MGSRSSKLVIYNGDPWPEKGTYERIRAWKLPNPGACPWCGYFRKYDQIRASGDSLYYELVHSTEDIRYRSHVHPKMCSTVGLADRRPDPRCEHFLDGIEAVMKTGEGPDLNYDAWERERHAIPLNEITR